MHPSSPLPYTPPPALVVAFLVVWYGMTVPNALQFVQHRRGIAEPNPGFMKAWGPPLVPWGPPLVPWGPPPSALGATP